MKKLDEKTLLRIFKEEWSAKLESAKSKLDVTFKKDGEEINVIHKGLKVKHEESGFMYTVAKVEPDSVTLKSPEGKLFTISNDEFENEYIVD